MNEKSIRLGERNKKLPLYVTQITMQLKTPG